MNKNLVVLLKILRKIYTTLNKSEIVTLDCVEDADCASQIISDALNSENPCMIGRFGSTELLCLTNYIGVTNDKNKYLGYIQGKTQPWWWEDSIINQMQIWSGFFPANEKKIEEFCRLMLRDLNELDVLGSWLRDEMIFDLELTNCRKIHFELLNPYFSILPWTRVLEGRRVLVVHPFAETIEKQFEKRDFLFANNVLPNFYLQTIKAVQSIAGTPTKFNDWFEALDYMKSEIDKCDYEICLIGCGAYGFPLAAHVKRKGKKAVHLGGSLQLLFGIRGKRWEDVNYSPIYNYRSLINEYWVRPDKEDKPTNASAVEDACYW